MRRDDRQTRTQAYDTPAYKQLESVLTNHFTTRLVPAAQCWADSLAGANHKIYVAMQGASEFTLGGELEVCAALRALERVLVASGHSARWLLVRGFAPPRPFLSLSGCAPLSVRARALEHHRA